MPQGVRRQDTIETLTTAAGWLGKAPELVGLFLVVGLVNAAGQLNVVVSLVGSLVGIVASAVTYLTAADLVAGRSPGVGDHVGTAVRKTPALVGIGLVAGFATLVGLIFLVIPGVYISLRLGLAAVACVVDDHGVSESLSTSWDVAEGNLLKLFAIQLVTGLASFVVVAVLLFVFASPDALLQNDRQALFRVYLGVAPVTAIVGPISGMAVGRVYLENRDDTDENLTAQPGDDDWTGSESAAATSEWSADDDQADGTDDDQSDRIDDDQSDGTDDDPVGSWPGEDRQ